MAYSDTPPSGGENGDQAREALENFKQVRDEIERLEQNLTDDRSLLKSALDNQPHGVFVCNTNGRFIYKNPAAVEIWGGFEEVETIEDWAEYRAYHEDGTAVEIDDWGLADALRRESVLEPRAVEIERFDGEQAIILGSASPFYGADGELRGAIAVFSDITDIKQVERAHQRARETAEHAAERMTALQEITADLFDVLVPDEAVQLAVDRAYELLDADLGAGSLLSSDGRVLEIVAERGRRESLDGHRSVAHDAPSPTAEAVRMAAGIFVSDREQYERRYPHLANGSPREETSDAFAVVPMLAGDDTIGTLGFAFDTPQTFEHHDRRFLETLATQCAQAVRRAELYQNEQRARAAAEEARRRAEFLSEASAVLNSSLDYDETLERVANLAVPEMADWCAVDLAGAEHTLAEPVAIAHTDPEKVEWAYEYRRKFPPDSETGGAAKVMETGDSLLLESLDESYLRQAAREEEHFEYLRRIGIESLMVVPMELRQRLLGAITFVSADPNDGFDEADLATAEELARRAATAVDNAELHRHTKEARRRVSRRAEQQNAVAGLARRALEVDCERLFDEALETMIDLLGADTAKLVRLDESGSLILHAGRGWNDEWLGADLGPPRDDTAIGRALLENEVVVAEDLDDSRHGPTELVKAHELRSAMTVQVPGPSRPYGAIGVHSTHRRTFTNEDSEFIRGISNILSDAIQKERIERERERTQQRLAASLREREQLLSMIAHDLRSPATAAQMNVEMIRQNRRDDSSTETTFDEYLEQVDRNIERMIDMMSGILEQGAEQDRSVEFERVDYAELLHGVLAGFEAAIAESDSEIELELEDELVGRTDRVRFDQIASNLLSNALKYGEGEPIEIELTGLDSEIELVVRDHGIGMEPEVRDDIFEQFERRTDRDSNSSYGLGLWIVRRSVDVLGGTIECESSPGEGTRFRVRLPRDCSS